ncbi:hypothetical protein AU375_04798 [Methylobacterium radiotolerans]|nr:hypothetical protein AU375_04798 [Methylobacterium radiotolerans]
MSVQVPSPAHVAIAAALSQCLGNIHGSANKASFVIESLTKAGFEIIRSTGPTTWLCRRPRGGGPHRRLTLGAGAPPAPRVTAS